MRTAGLAPRPFKTESDKMPKRIQRKRTKGWRNPEGSVYVGRPTVFGNPFKVKIFGRRKAVSLYRGWILKRISQGRIIKIFEEHEELTAAEELYYWATLCEWRKVVLDRLPELRGKDLSDWCALDGDCHADVLLELANK